MAGTKYTSNQDSQGKGVKEFLANRRLCLIRVAGLQRLDEDFCNQLEFLGDRGYALLGTSFGSSLRESYRAREGLTSNQTPQPPKATSSNGGRPNSRYIEDDSVPGCSGIQNGSVWVEPPHAPVEPEKSDSSLDQDFDYDEFEDSADEELEFEVSDDDIKETADSERVSPIHRPVVESGELLVKGKRLSPKKADSKSGKMDRGDPGRPDSDHLHRNGITCDKNLTGESRGETLEGEKAPLPKNGASGTTVGRLHGEKSTIEENDDRKTQDGAVDLRSEITKLRLELFGLAQSPRKKFTTKNKKGQVLENGISGKANAKVHRAQTANNGGIVERNTRIRKREDFEEDMVSLEGPPSTNNGIEIYVKEDLEDTLILERTICSVSQNSQSSIHEEGEENDDPDSDGFQTDDCQATDGFQTADDAVSETDSVGTFFDCEDEVPGSNHTHSEASRGRMSYEVGDSRRVDEEHNYFYSRPKVTVDPAIKGDMPDGTDSSSSSGSFDDTVMDQTTIEAAPKTPTPDDVSNLAATPGTEQAELNELGLAGGEEPPPPYVRNIKGATAHTVVENVEDVEMLSDGSSEDASQQMNTDDAKPDVAVGEEKSTEADVVSTGAFALVSATTSNGSALVETSQIKAEGGSENEGVSESTEKVSSSDVVAEKPAEKNRIGEQRAKDGEVQDGAKEVVASPPIQEQKPQEETGGKKPASDQAGLKDLSDETAKEGNISGLDKLGKLLTKECDSSATEIMSRLKTEKYGGASLEQKRKLIVKALKNCSHKNARIFVGMLKEHLLRVRYLVRTTGDSELPVSAEVIQFIWDLSLVDYLKLEEFIDRTAAQLSSPIAKMISPTKVAGRVHFHYSMNRTRL